jgi:hypothetical protein
MTFTDIFLPAVLILIVVMAGAWSLWHSWHRHRITGANRERIVRRWEAACGQADLHRRVLEADAVFTEALRLAGFAGTTGEMLKKAGSRIAGLNDVWRAHKLRNRLAHEAGTQPSAREVDDAITAFDKALRRFTR